VRGALSDVCEFIVDCEHKTAPLTAEGAPSIRTPNVGRGRLLLDSVNRVSTKTYAAWTKRARPQANDIIIAREAPVGNAAIIREGQVVCLGQRTVLARPNPRLIDPDYLVYFLLAEYCQSRFRAVSQGATVAHLNMKDIRELALPDLPSLAAQRQIGSLLAAYDDLIEANQRRIAILEEIARRLFEEWFVRFRYPGHDSETLVETDLGSTPEGWKRTVAGELIEFDPRTRVEKEGVKTFVPMGSLSTTSIAISEWETRSGNSGSKFQNGDTLLARITPCLENGKTGYVDFLGANETAFGSTEYIVMRGRSVPATFVQLLARSERFRAAAIGSMGGSDGRQRARAEALEKFEIAAPPKPLIDQFDRVAAPMFAAVRCLTDQNARLRAARDLLLPKLISGEIDVGAIA